MEIVSLDTLLSKFSIKGYREMWRQLEGVSGQRSFPPNMGAITCIYADRSNTV